MPKLTSTQLLISIGNNIVFCAILSSFLAGFYGMFYYNNWNLYAMAQEQSIPFSHVISFKNRHGIPWVCVLIQSCMIMLAVLILQTSSALVTIGDFGVLFAYALSILSFLRAGFSLLGIGALFSCATLMYMCGLGVLDEGALVMLPFILVMTIGAALFACQRLISSRTTQGR